ncbi:5'-methylthioadenosine/adenosylhomocysteine nucleosidase [Paenibacillus sp. sgz500958]|uniref:5'-methylthioadenosine/adenosylhomocysteine nucleosidase n=1 Tax=Paenibacillus sp. sgz500958 TaxID=3242475 RepID=UPI0036D23C7D
MGQMIGLIGAMDEEIRLLLDGMEDRKTVTKAGTDYFTGIVKGKSVVVCKSGVGKVNAAVTAQILADTFQVSSVLFTGVAGALHPNLEIGDIVISSECMQHDMDATALGFARGVIPYQEVSCFPADSALVALAEQACLELDVAHMTGTILSGDRFIADPLEAASLHEQMGGLCTEMEGAAVAQVCYMNNVPFAILRAMSDKADGSAHVNFAEFTVASSLRSHMILEAMLDLM